MLWDNWIPRSFSVRAPFLPERWAPGKRPITQDWQNLSMPSITGYLDPNAHRGQPGGESVIWYREVPGPNDPPWLRASDKPWTATPVLYGSARSWNTPWWSAAGTIKDAFNEFIPGLDHLSVPGRRAHRSGRVGPASSIQLRIDRSGRRGASVLHRRRDAHLP